ncbi:MAG: ATP-binding protein [Bryobacteraceae bacterium]|nr:ATP-binding protein [Bryobacteraceae bacterium]
MKLLWRLWLSTSLSLTMIFAVAGWWLQRHAIDTGSRSVEEAVQNGFQAYESVWRTRGELLSTVTAVLSSMPNVRAAFGTRDEATIRDSASELWGRLPADLKETAFFIVASPDGEAIASLGENRPPARSWNFVSEARSRFPQQVTGVMLVEGQMYQTVLTPVYVDAGQGRALLNVLVAGYPVNPLLASRLKESTGGSEFLFVAGKKVFASTLNPRATSELALRLSEEPAATRVSDGVTDYALRARALAGPAGEPSGTLYILRSYADSLSHLDVLRRDLLLMWALAVAAALAVSYWIVRRVVRPVEELDRAATEIAKQNYDYRVRIESDDELGRLGKTFNAMSTSIQSAREELIRQERLSTIARLASSIVHDLRNPLAAIYGGAELLSDEAVPEPQRRRLASNVLRASQRIQGMLNDLANVTRGKSAERDSVSLRDLLELAVENSRALADAHEVRVVLEPGEDAEARVEKGRLERVFLNLISNAIEAMPNGGEVRISLRNDAGETRIDFRDTGPGLLPEVRDRLFQPFVTKGKKNGLGLGLALSRQTLLDHGGDIEVSSPPGQGATFTVVLRGAAVAAAAG